MGPTAIDRFVTQKRRDKEVLDRLIAEFVATDERPAAVHLGLESKLRT